MQSFRGDSMSLDFMSVARTFEQESAEQNNDASRRQSYSHRCFLQTILRLNQSSLGFAARGSGDGEAQV